MTTPGAGEGGLFHFRQDIDVALNEIKRSLEAFPGKIDPLSQRIQDSLIFDAAFSSEGIGQFITEVEQGVGRAVGLFEGAGPLINEALAKGVNPERAFSAFSQQAVEEVARLQRIFTEGLGKGLIPPSVAEQLNGLAAKVSASLQGVASTLPGGGGAASTGITEATERLQATTRTLVDALLKEVAAAENRISVQAIADGADRRYAEARNKAARLADEGSADASKALREQNAASREVATSQKQLAAATRAEAEASAFRLGISAAAERDLADAAVRTAERSTPRPPRVTPQQLIDESTPNPQNPIFRGGPTAEDPLAGRTIQISPNVFGRTEDANSRPQFFETKPAQVSEEGGFFPPSAERVDPQVDPTRVANLERKFEEASTGTARLTEQELRVGEAARILEQRQQQLAVQLGNTNRYYDLLNNEVLTLTRETKGPARGQLGATTVSTGEQAQAAFSAELGRLQTTALGLNAAMKRDTEALEREARQADLAVKLDDGRAQTLRGGQSIKDLTTGQVFDTKANEITNPLQLRRLNQQAEPPKGLLDSFLGGLTSKGFNSEGDESPGLTGIAGTAGNLAKYGLVAKALQDVFAVVGQLKAGIIDESKALTNLDEALQGTAASAVNYADASTAAAQAGIADADAINIGAKAIQVYGNEIRNNTDANRVFAESIKAVGVAALTTGLSTADAQKALFQATQGFGVGSGGQDRINNAVSNAARNFRGDRGEILKGVGVASGAADLAGVGPEELANIVSLIQGRTQQGGEQVGTSLTRLLSREGDKVFQQALSRAQISNTGDIGGELGKLSDFFNSLQKGSGGSQEAFIKSLGGRGALKDLLPLFESGNQLGSATEKSLLNGSAAADDFNKRINSLAGEIATIIAEFKDLATEIGKSGVFAPLGVALEALRPTLALLDSILKAFNSIPSAIRLPLVAFGELTLALRVFQAAAAQGITLRGIIGLGAAKAGAAASNLGESIAASRGANANAGIAATRPAEAAATAEAEARLGVTTNASAVAAEREATARTRLQTVLDREVATLTSDNAANVANLNLLRELNVAVDQRISAVRNLGVLEGEELTAARAAITQTEAEILVRREATAVIEQEALALQGLGLAEEAAALRGAAGAVPLGVPGAIPRTARAAETVLPEAETGLIASTAGRAGTAIKGFATSLTGMITIAIAAGIAVKSAVGETDRLIASYNTQRDAAKGAAEAGPGGLTDAIAKLTAAGEARAKGASGVFGTTEDAIIRLFGGQGGRDARKDDQTAAKELLAESKAIDKQAADAATRGDAGAFNGRITSIEQLTAGVARLDATGTSAARTVQAIVDAFTGVTKIGPAVAAASISGSLAGIATGAVTDVLGQPTGQAEKAGLQVPGGRVGRSILDGLGAVKDLFTLHPIKAAKDVIDGGSNLITGDPVFGEGNRNFSNFNNQFTDPKKVADTRKKIGELTDQAVKDAGVQNVSDLSDQQKADLATKIAALYTGDSHIRAADLAKIRAEIATKIENNLNDIANTIPQGDQVTSTAVQALVAQRAKAAGQQQGSIAGGDPVVAAQATLDGLLKEAQIASASGTQITAASLADIADARRALASGLAAQGKAYNDLAVSASPADAAFGLAKAVEDANNKLAQDVAAGASAVQQVQDQTAINNALTAQRAGQFADQNALNLNVRGGNAGNLSFGADGSVTGGATDPRALTDQANAKLINARNNLNLARSNGATGANLANAVGAYTQAYFDYANAVVTDANAARDGAVAIGDKVGEAYAKAADALAAANALRAGSPQQAAALRAAGQLASDAGILAIQTAVAADTQNTDPRDKVQLARDQVELDNSTLGATPQADVAAGAALRKKVAADRVAQAQAEADLANANREAATDPRDTLREAADATARARDNLNNQLRGTQGYAEAQKALRVAQLAQAQAATALANAARDAGADPASQVQQATARLADATALLQLDLIGSDAYYKDLKQVNDAKVALANANLAAARDTAELGIDTTNPFAEAQLALASAQAKLATDRNRKAAPDVINADLLNVEKTQAAAQKTQLDQQLSLHAQQFDLRQISLAQYLTFLRNQDTSLRAQLAATKVGSQGYQQLVDELNGVDQTIKSVNQQASGLFNIGTIKAPTVFEVRRLLGVDQRTDPTVFQPVTTALTSLAQPSVQAANQINAVTQALKGVGAAAQGAVANGQLTGAVVAPVTTAVAPTINNVSINGADLQKVLNYINSILGPTANRNSTVPKKVR